MEISISQETLALYEQGLAKLQRERTDLEKRIAWQEGIVLFLRQEFEKVAAAAETVSANCGEPIPVGEVGA